MPLFLQFVAFLLTLISSWIDPAYSFMYSAAPPTTRTSTHRKTRIRCYSEAATNSELGAISSSASPAVVCIGDALFDCIANDNARGLSVDEMVQRNAWTAFPGGAPANVATACKKLGSSSAFVGCVGDDADGDELEALLRSTGVDVTLLQRAKAKANKNLPTRRVMVTRSLKGDREFGGFYEGRSANDFADCVLDTATLMQQEQKSKILAGASWLVCSTLSLAFENSAHAIYRFVDRGLEGNTKLYVDINWRPVFWPLGEANAARAREEILCFARRAHIVKLTDEEAEWLLDIPGETALADPKQVHDHFPNAYGVLVTAGEKGAAYSVFGCVGRVEPFRVKVTETTGAGDAFTAGFLHGLLTLDIDLDEFQTLVPLKEKSLIVDQLVRFAAAVGALTCTKEGAIAAQPTFSEVESFLIHGEKVW
jgi:fructokinase